MAETPVVLTITDDEGNTEERTLGEWHDVWSKGVTIGSDDQCDIVLAGDEIEPLHVRVTRPFHHHALVDIAGPVGVGRKITSAADEAYICEGIGDPPPLRIGAHTLTFRSTDTTDS